MKKWIQKAWERPYRSYTVIWLLFSALIGVRLTLHTLYGLPSFDGAMNLQVPVSLMDYGTYATLYNGGKLYDISVQTGVPVLAAIYVIFCIFGVGITQALVVNAVYLVLMLILIDRICKALDMPGAWRFLCIGSLFLLRNVYEYSMGVYGEVPAAVWFLLCVWLLMKWEAEPKWRWLLLSGLAYGMALLTKTVLLIALPALCIVFLSKIFLEKRYLIRDVLKWGAACAVPCAIFQTVKFISVGSSAFRSLTDRLLGGILKQAGVVQGYSDTAGTIIHKFAVHMGILSDYIGLHEIVLFLVLGLNFVYWLYRTVNRKHAVLFDIVVLVAYSYFGWWLLITPTAKAWERRIFIGVIFMIMVIVWHVYEAVRGCAWKERRKLELCICIALLAAVYMRQVTGMLRVDYGERNAVEEDGQYIRQIAQEEPDAVFCGNGWWQAPLQSFVSGITFYDINDIDGDTLYYVKDKYERQEDDGALDALSDILTVEKVYDNRQSGTEIYRVIEKAPYERFTEEEYRGAWRRSLSKEEGQEGVRGLNGYEADSGNCWAEQEVGILLAPQPGDKELVFQYRIMNLQQINADDMEIGIYINGELVDTERPQEDGDYTACIDISRFSGMDWIEVRISANGRLDTGGDERELSYLFECIYLE